VGWATQLDKAATAAGGISGAFGKVGVAALGAVAVGAAAFEGWQLGTWARENFSWVAQIGQWLGAGIATA
jgi:hypothetical protein